MSGSLPASRTPRQSIPLLTFRHHPSRADDPDFGVAFRHSQPTLPNNTSNNTSVSIGAYRLFPILVTDEQEERRSLPGIVRKEHSNDHRRSWDFKNVTAG